MEPASKVSVPLTVVMRTRSRVADKDLDPEVKHCPNASVRALFALNTHKFVAESSKDIFNVVVKVVDAAIKVVYKIGIPDVNVCIATVLGAANATQLEVYPVFSMPPESPN